jgi:hypothetical protein
MHLPLWEGAAVSVQSCPILTQFHLIRFIKKKLMVLKCILQITQRMPCHSWEHSYSILIMIMFKMKLNVSEVNYLQYFGNLH